MYDDSCSQNGIPSETLFAVPPSELHRYVTQRSQLSLIFDVIGTPGVQQLYWLDNRTKAMLAGIEHKPRRVRFHFLIELYILINFLI
jgi:hypothetical protein